MSKTTEAIDEREIDDVQSLSWHGQIPAELSLSRYDVTDLKAPEPIYLMLPRMGYLHTASREAIAEFQKSSLSALTLGGGSGDDVVSSGGRNSSSSSSSSSSSGVSSVWFSYQGTPLKFHLPVGVLFDVHNVRNGVLGVASSAVLPWKITVHFTSYPADVLLMYDGEHTIESSFSQSLKQALYLEHGNSKVAMSISKDHHLQLWESVKTNNFELYSEINRTLLADVTLSAAAAQGEEAAVDLRSEEEKEDDRRRAEIRVRLDREKREREGKSAEESDDEKAVKKRDIVSVPIRVIVASNLKAAPLQVPIKDAGLSLKQTLDCFGVEDSGQRTVMINGIDSIAMNTPIAELWRTCQSADHFLYIAIK